MYQVLRLALVPLPMVTIFFFVLVSFVSKVAHLHGEYPLFFVVKT